MTTWKFGKLRLASYPNVDGSEKIARENSGAVILMAGEDDATTRVGTIDMRVKPKRGEGWKTDDPEQEEIARFIIDAVNAAIDRER